MRAPGRHPLGERHLREVVGVRQVIDAGHHDRAEHLAVGDHAADRHAAEADAVIALLAPDEAGPAALAAQTLIAVGHLQRGIDRLGTRVGEEHARQSCRRHRRDAFGERERHRVGELEGGGVVELLRLIRQRLDNLRVAVAERAAPQAGQGVEQLAAVGHDEVRALGPGDQLRMLAEIAIGRKRQPVVVQPLRRTDLCSD